MSSKQEISDDLSNFKIVSLKSSEYMKPFRVQYEINNFRKNWDFMKVHDSVSILIYNKTRDAVVLVKQFRPAAYVGQLKEISDGTAIDTNEWPVTSGYTLELCAGIVDKKLSLEEIAREEVLEECGYDVPASRLQKIFSFKSVGCTSNTSHIFYVEVEDIDKKGKGGGLHNDGEFIQIIEMQVEDFRKYINRCDLDSPAGLAAAALWFFSNVKI